MCTAVGECTQPYDLRPVRAGQLYFCEPTMDAREAMAAELQVMGCVVV